MKKTCVCSVLRLWALYKGESRNFWKSSGLYNTTKRARIFFSSRAYKRRLAPHELSIEEELGIFLSVSILRDECIPHGLSMEVDLRIF